MKNKIHKLCENVLALTDADFKEVEEMIGEQSGFVHPLKGKKQAFYNELGAHNKRIVEAVKHLRTTIQNKTT